MELRDAIAARVSVRQFRKDPVSAGDVREMIRLASLAPSPNNQQPWRFIAVSRATLLSEMADAVHARVRDVLPAADSDDARHAAQRVDWFSTFFAEAPLVIAVTRRPYTSIIDRALPGTPPERPDINALRGYPDIQSVGAAIEHLLLAATELGYGSCWMSGPLIARDALERLLAIDPPEQLAALVALGRPAVEPAAGHDRQPVDALLRFID
jgi:nitroreductase